MCADSEFNAIAFCDLTFDLVIWPSCCRPLLGHPAVKLAACVCTSTSVLSLHPQNGSARFKTVRPHRVRSMCGFLESLFAHAWKKNKNLLCWNLISTAPLGRSQIPCPLCRKKRRTAASCGITGSRDENRAMLLKRRLATEEPRSSWILSFV